MTVRTPDNVKPSVLNFGKEIVKLAENFLGVREHGSPNTGITVEMFQRAVDGKALGESWCMAFVQYNVIETGKIFKATPVLFKSEHCMTVWNKTPYHHRTIRPEVGSIVIWRNGDGPQGHTAVVSRVIDENSFETIEGNTGADTKTIVREGDGVYRKVRAMRPKGSLQLMGFLSPFDPMRVVKKVI